MRDSIESYLNNHASLIKSFWSTGNSEVLDCGTLQDHADYIYVRALLGDKDWYCESALDKYAAVLIDSAFAGRVGCQEHLLPHISAYALASLNLLALAGADVRGRVLGKVRLDLDLLIDRQTYLPKWPAKWSHHTWRVSHWIGGIPSILLTFARHDPNRQIDEALVCKVLEACDKAILQPNTGLMKAYKSELLQQCFRVLYRLRHNPEHGDIGGLVHIHWINHVLGRNYIAADKLIDRCMEHMQDGPFLESVPYCLDFDYMQLIRTALEQRPEKESNAITSRVEIFRRDLVSFLGNIPTEGYSLHKLPGALATYHEANLILNREAEELNIKSVDIIKMAYWL
ncbi:hypothetical protein [Bowmanella yangjiangensis]|uniref:Uncharacterized protein n=1 Tax=Bowmanella yangjiangensis TaxID=2811230 RepID=A0ABS3CT36_9ALTE|nr:hypothetical protein [Bowmanella yangjiangensis]MBN7820220.1 hypothetical protein [Bowmanella yangjiangensis]